MSNIKDDFAPKVTKGTIEQWELWAEDILMNEYPWYPWVVTINPFIGELNIQNLVVDKTAGMIVDMKKGETVSALTTKIKKFGGELLERRNLPRSSTPEKAEEFLIQAQFEYMTGINKLQKLDKTGIK